MSLVKGTTQSTRYRATRWVKWKTDSSLDIERIVSAYWHYGRVYKIRSDIALAQAVKETGWFRFGGDVKASQNNFAGIGATGRVAGYAFPTIEAGVAAHVCRMAMYSIGRKSDYDLDILYRPLGRNHWGAYPHIEDYNGVWAYPGKGYGESIMKLVRSM